MKLIKQLLFFGLSFALTLLVCEVYIRTTHLVSVSPNEYYEDIGRGRRENLQFVYFNEGLGVGKFNKERFIGKSVSKKKDKNTIRIILLGDSYVESFQIFERHYFGKIAEKYLQSKHPDLTFEILNFGRSGFDITDMYAYQKTLAEKFDPDFILYMVSNDDLIQRAGDPLVPTAKIENDSLVVAFDFDPTALKNFQKTKSLIQHSSVLNMLNNGRKKVASTNINALLFDKVYTWFAETPKGGTGGHTDEAHIISPVVEKIIKNMDPKKVVIVGSGHKELALKFRELCTVNNITQLDISKKLHMMKENGDDPYAWKVTGKEGHWNFKAHEVVGEELGKMLDKLIEK